jgi:hypothetical protein
VFLGLTTYYRKFVQQLWYNISPFNPKLEERFFHLVFSCGTSFHAQLKQVMNQSFDLSLLDFSETFVVECDASDSRVGAVLIQEQLPIANTM